MKHAVEKCVKYNSCALFCGQDEGSQLESRDENKMWLVRHLEITRQLMIDDLKVVKVSFCVSVCLPPSPPPPLFISCFLFSSYPPTLCLFSLHPPLIHKHTFHPLLHSNNSFKVWIVHKFITVMLFDSTDPLILLRSQSSWGGPGHRREVTMN